MRATAALPARPLGLGRFGFAALAVAPVLLLLLVRLLPADGVGAGLRMSAAAACVLLVPGAVVLRAIGWPDALGVAAAGAVAWSLVALFGAMALTFATGGSLSRTIALVAATTLASLVSALWPRPGRASLLAADTLAVAGVALAALPFAAAAWWVHRSIIRDQLFHLAYARKLEELPALDSLDVVAQFGDAGLHPGYAFPLWHGVLGVIARLAGVDVADVVLHLGAVLTPLALVLAYAVGAALFRSRAAGIATAAGYVLLRVVETGDRTGAYGSISDPDSAAIGLLIPALLALVFAFAAGGGWALLPTIGAASLALVVVHPNYAPYLLIPLGGFLLARALLEREDRGDVKRIGMAMGAILLPAGLFILWLWPVVADTNPVTPNAETVRRGIADYAGYFQGSPDSFRVNPGAITRQGPAVVAGLLAVPLAVVAARRRWAAFVLGGTLSILVILLLPPLFTTFADYVSLSQARRLIGFLPLPFALAGAAVLLGRLRVAGVALALGAALSLQALYEGSFEYRISELGPAWPVWLALAGGAAALALGVLRPRLGPAPGAWAAATALAFVLPFTVAGFLDLEKEPRDDFALSPGLVSALRTEAEPLDVVIARDGVAYRAAAYAPLRVVAVPLQHSADTKKARPFERGLDNARFFAAETPEAERRAILTEYDVSWVVVDRRRGTSQELLDFLSSFEHVHDGRRYELYRVAGK